ncbi:MAG: serpin family protein [Bacteroidales bacterium]|nr:serpin family protein [Bacteroidales bacterium]
MNRIVAFTFLSLFAGWFISCEQEQDPRPDLKPKEIPVSAGTKQLIESDNQLGIELFKQVIDGQESDTNTLVSPLSVSLALAMTYNGAAGETKSAMEETMHLEGFTKQQINESYRSLMKELLSVDPKVTMELAQSIWYYQGFSVEEDFLNVNREYYNAEVQSLDFAAPDAVDIINQWCSDQTHGKIQEILDRIPEGTVMYLINALYFNGTWKYEFDPSLTDRQPFYPNGGNEITTDMMHLEGDVRYQNNELFKAVELPYGRGNYTMVCLMPHHGLGADELAGKMTDEKWDQWMQSFEKWGCYLSLPKFKFEFSDLLNEPLKKMGMSVAFDQYNADFSGINPLVQLYISRVLHKTFIEVDEKGTEAAAVTAVEIARLTASGGSAPLTVTFDRPFLFAIREVSTGTIMFLGKLEHPGNASDHP